MKPDAIEVLADAEALARRAADWLVETLSASTDEALAVALAGGSTPRSLYRLLATPAYAAKLPWARIHWFWGDERFVPPDHPDSNYRMAREAMLSHTPVPAANIHPIPTEGLTPRASAADYERTLRAARGPYFHVTLLGLGPDGHIASLFPGSGALQERQRWVVAVEGEKPEARISLTYPALEASREIAFLVAGKEKYQILQRILAGSDLPAGRLKPSGSLRFFLDRAAAGEIAL